MNKISINNIFGDDGVITTKHNKLSVETMFTKINENDIKRKLNAKKCKKEKILQSMYDTKYKECLAKIHQSLDDNVKNIFYTIPFVYSKQHCDYSSLKCLEFISEKLIDNGFYCEIISNTQIYISWRNL